MCKDDKKCIEGIINGIKDIPSGIDPNNPLDNELINNKDLPSKHDFI